MHAGSLLRRPGARHTEGRPCARAHVVVGLQVEVVDVDAAAVLRRVYILRGDALRAHHPVPVVDRVDPVLQREDL